MSHHAAFCIPAPVNTRSNSLNGTQFRPRQHLRRPQQAPQLANPYIPPARTTPLCAAGFPFNPRPSRRAVLALLAALPLSARQARAGDADTRETDGTSSPLAQPDMMEVDADGNTKERPMVGRQTATGITFIDYTPGEGDTPEWGDFVNIDYVLYTVNDTRDGLVEYETTLKTKGGALFHHGNGELVKGLEEMIHSMRPGARRRCIIPPSSAYVRTGLLPIPRRAGTRKKFFAALDKDGTVVFDVRLNFAMRDPDDRGYYTDIVPSSEEEIMELFRKSRENAS